MRRGSWIWPPSLTCCGLPLFRLCWHYISSGRYMHRLYFCYTESSPYAKGTLFNALMRITAKIYCNSEAVWPLSVTEIIFVIFQAMTSIQQPVRKICGLFGKRASSTTTKVRTGRKWRAQEELTRQKSRCGRLWCWQQHANTMMQQNLGRRKNPVGLGRNLNRGGGNLHS